MNNFNTDKKSLIRRLNRGTWSISSRKYLPKLNLSEVFDEEELKSQAVGMD